MIKVYNSTIPSKGYLAITLWPFIFIRKDVTFDEVDLNHENIHGRQQLEMLLIPFYIWYGIEWFIKLFTTKDAYMNISFEREAYANESNLEYLKERKWYSWIRYLRKE